jgi:pyruvate formate lyase activating enzyme
MLNKRAALMHKKPLVLDIKGNSLDDGPGIRTVVFLKGCPLSCFWCHNPESKNPDDEISFDAAECIACDECLETCSTGALSRSNRFFIDRNKCNLCFECTETCPSGALSKVGRQMTIKEIVEAVVKDKTFFHTSGGGVTLSGGEPAMFMDYLSELLTAFKAQGIHTLIETCGQFNLERFMRLVYPHLDMVYYDIKIYDTEEHARLCGAGNRTILENFAALQSRYLSGGIEIMPRIPLIPGMTDTDANINAIASFLKELHVKRAQLMAYHPLWREKGLKIGLDNPVKDDRKLSGWADKDRLKACKQIFRNASIHIE